MLTTDDVRHGFLAFAHHTAHDSPLYSRLSPLIATDEDLVRLCQCGRAPISNLFLAAVQAELAKSKHPLRQWYPHLATGKAREDDPWTAFRAFALDHADAIRKHLTTRRVQTNEVGRAVYLLPTFSRLAAGRPVALIEFGASMGLNLCLDHFRVETEEGAFGDPSARLTLRTAWSPRESTPTDGPPHVVWRVGIDLHPLNVESEPDREWLQALVWPEQTDRRPILDRAMQIAREVQPHVRKGDAVEEVATLALQTPAEAVPIVFQTHVFYQLSAKRIERFHATLLDASMQRPIWFVSRHDDLRVTHYDRGSAMEYVVASPHHHGRWVRDWCWPDDLDRRSRQIDPSSPPEQHR